MLLNNLLFATEKHASAYGILDLIKLHGESDEFEIRNVFKRQDEGSGNEEATTEATGDDEATEEPGDDEATEQPLDGGLEADKPGQAIFSIKKLVRKCIHQMGEDRGSAQRPDSVVTRRPRKGLLRPTEDAFFLKKPHPSVF